MEPENTGDYHVTFLARHPDDKHLCDDKARWWPEWYEYKLDSSNVSIYGARMLFLPKRKQNPKTYMFWSDSVHFTDSKYFIHEPFNYNTHNNIIQLKQYVALTHWNFYFLFAANLVLYLLHYLL